MTHAEYFSTVSGKFVLYTAKLTSWVLSMLAPSNKDIKTMSKQEIVLAVNKSRGFMEAISDKQTIFID